MLRMLDSLSSLCVCRGKTICLYSSWIGRRIYMNPDDLEHSDLPELRMLRPQL